MDVGEPHVTAAEADGQLGVIHAKQVQHGGVEIVNIQAFINGLVAVLVGGAIHGAALHAAAGHPEAEAEGIVIASVAALREGGAAEFAHPHDQRAVEQPAAFEIAQQGGDGFVDGFGVFLVTALEAAVLIPAIAVAAGAGQLNKAHAALDKAPGNQAVAAKGGRVAERIVEAVAFLGGLGFAIDIHQLRHGRLHAEGQLMIGDGGFHLVEPADAAHHAGVQLANEVQLVLLQLGRGLGAADVGNRFVAVLEHAALIGRRQKAV